MVFAENVRGAFADAPYDGDEDQADTVETIIIIAGFAVAALAAVGWITTALQNKAADVADCVQGSQAYGSQAANSNKTACSSSHSSNAANSWSNDAAAQSRFGGA